MKSHLSELIGAIQALPVSKLEQLIVISIASRSWEVEMAAQTQRNRDEQLGYLSVLLYDLWEGLSEASQQLLLQESVIVRQTLAELPSPEDR